MTRWIRLGASFLLASAAAVATAAPEPVPQHDKASFVWPVAEGWRKETIPFPLEFAPDLALSGVEEIRFAPGMFKPGEDGYWSYAFVWWLDGRPALARFKASFHALPPPPKKLGHAVQAFAGTVDSYDAFATGKPIVLQLEVHVWDCAEAGRRVAMILASPQPESAPIWTSLHARRDEFVCHNPSKGATPP
jgi:hypothetical protein